MINILRYVELMVNISMDKNIRYIMIVFFLSLMSFIYPNNLFARNSIGKCETSEECRQDIAEAEKKLESTRKEKNTLTNEIKLLNTQISIAINKTFQTENSIKLLEKEISTINISIGELEKNLDRLAESYITQVRSSYINSKKYSAFYTIMSADFSSILRIKKYINTLQEKTKNDLIGYETVRMKLDIQKGEKTAKQDQLTKLKDDLKEQSKTLTIHKSNKDSLLELTKNDESKYQKMLQQSQQELESINAILSGKGTESKLRDVSNKDKIGTVIQGASCNSSGTHLHFIVKKNGSSQNPLNFLSSSETITNVSGDPSSATGSWSWPLVSPIKFNQGYGITSSIKNSWVGRIYSFHNGIDINSSSTDVLATHGGELYKGTYKGSGGCSLKYTRVVDKANNLETLYLHID